MQALQRCDVLDALSQYTPTVVSTLWVGLDIETSDIDVICCYQNQQHFIDDLTSSYQHRNDFRLSVDSDRVVASFDQDGFCIELFATAQPIEQQPAYKHFKVMQRLTELDDGSFSAEVKTMKQKGIKTEPAIAQLLELEGDPFEAVAGLLETDDNELRELLEKLNHV